MLMRALRTGIAMLVVLAASPAGAVDSYEACLDLVAQDPRAAEREALAWEQAGGGAAASHCRAMSLVALGADGSAAALLVKLATGDRSLPDPVRADLLVAAGELYLGLGDVKTAGEVAERALLLVPRGRGPLVLSARVRAEKQDWAGSLAELNAALAEGAPDGETLALRGAAKLKLGDRVGARADLIWATEIAPDAAAVWLERGTLEAVNGDRGAARTAWLKAIDLDRDGPVAEAARLRLQKMEAGEN
jgi:tetratricopeptide (TPR) repeat protein